MTVDDMYEVQLCGFMYDLTQGNLPTPLQDIFTINRNLHSHNTRHRHAPHTQSRRSAFASRSLLHAGPKLWQTVPMDLKRKCQSKAFKTSYKKYILSKK